MVEFSNLCGTCGGRASWRVLETDGDRGAPRWGDHPAWRGARWGRRPVPLVEDSCRAPGVAVAAHGRRGVALASPGRVVEAIKACGEVRLQHPCRLLVALALERSPRLPGAPSRTKAIAVRRTWRFPCRFQGVFADALRGTVRDSRDPPRALLGRAGLGNVHPSSWRRFPVERQVMGHRQSCWWREGRETSDARGLLAPMVWRDLPYR
jgi:hypothetical protein